LSLNHYKTKKMKTITYLSVLIIAMVLNDSVQAQVLTLSEIKTSIRAQHPTVGMFDAEAKSMDAAAEGAWSWMPPEIGTGFFMMPYNPAFIRETDMDEGMGQYVISVEQMIPNRKRQEAEFKYMSTMSSAIKEKKEGALNELIADAKKNYVEWVVLAKKTRVLNDNEKLLEFMIKNAEIRYKNGMDKLGAYYKAKAALGRIINMRIMLENEINIRRIQLNTLMNKRPETYFEIDTSYRIEDFKIEELDTTLIATSRSDLREIEKDIQLITWQEQFEKAKLKPEFGIRFEHMIGLGGQPAQYSAMGMVRLPLVSWASRMNKANVASLKLQTESLRYKRQMVINELSGMASTMMSELDAKEKQIILLEDTIIPALENNYRTMQIAYEQNTEELFELFDAWESMNMAQLEYLDQLQELYMLHVDLERILEIK